MPERNPETDIDTKAHAGERKPPLPGPPTSMPIYDIIADIEQALTPGQHLEQWQHPER